MSKEKGFNAIAIVLIVVAVAVLAFVFWRVWDAGKQKPSGPNDNQQSTQQEQAHGPVKQTDPNEGYMVIKEFGIKIKLSDDIKDAIHHYDDSNQSYPKATISTQSLVNISNGTCSPEVSNALGAIVKASEQNPANGDLILQINNDYLYYRSPTSVCSQDQSALKKLSELSNSISSAIDTAQVQ